MHPVRTLCIVIAAIASSGVLLASSEEASPSIASSELELAVEDGVLYLPAGFCEQATPYFLHIHFHGAPQLAISAHREAGWNTALLALHRNGFSSVYEAWLAPDSWLSERLADVDAKVLKHSTRARAPQIKLSAFSAGYAAVRALLQREADFTRIGAVHLADALHAGYDGEQRPRADQMAPFLRFARAAIADRARFQLTHTEIKPPGYASVAECADYLLSELGLPREESRVAEADQLERRTRTVRGGFEVLGFAGDQAADHVRHFRRLWHPIFDLEKELEKNTAAASRYTRLARRHSMAWLASADPRTGLLPRTLRGDRYWNAKDCAADNLPFLGLTGEILGDHHLRRAAAHLLAQERRLCNRIGVLPDDFDFARQGFRRDEPVLSDVIFGAAEYSKDGLAPWFEWAGPGAWYVRMQELVVGVWEHAGTDLPSRDIEVLGDLMQVCARLARWTGDPRYRDWSFRLADEFLVHGTNLLDSPQLALRDHGCEVIGGLAEVYVLAVEVDPERRERYRARLYALLDRILEIGRDERGLLFDAVDPRSGARMGSGFSDGFGYVYDAFLCVDAVDHVPRYREAVSFALQHLGNLSCAATPGFEGADGHADAIESALNLMQRLPERSAARFIELQMDALCGLQRADGVIEGWYGDGNSARTALMVALWKTQGVAPEPWVESLHCGAVHEPDGSVVLQVHSEWAWEGVLRFDRPRHRDVQHLPLDMARINQFPEWFTVERHQRYEVIGLAEEPRLMYGSELWRLPMKLRAGETKRLSLRPLERRALRSLAYRAEDAEGAARWQRAVREELAALLKLSKAAVPLDVVEVSRTAHTHYDLIEIEFSATAQRRIAAWFTQPHGDAQAWPAVVCIHGHGGTRRSVHDPASVYRGFAKTLAESGYATIAVDVGQHTIYEEGSTLLGERLSDLMRCVDLLVSRADIDPQRIGCAGLSLGGEMAMWLGALDERVRACVSAGFLTTMDQLEQGHCLCWDLPGLRERVDFADIYALTAPRALQCQNGLAEPPQDFCVPLARQALSEIAKCYVDLGAPERAELHVHPGGHIVDVAALMHFFERSLSLERRTKR